MKKITAMTLAGLLVLTGCNATKSPTTAPTRSVGNKISDIVIEREVLASLDKVAGLTKKNHRIAIDAFLGQVLLTGEVPSQEVQHQVLLAASQINGVTKVHNALTVASEPKSQSHTVHENYLKSKLQAKLLTTDIRSNQYYVTVRNDWAYLLGTLTPAQFAEVKRLSEETDGILGLKSLATLAVSEGYIADTATASSDSQTPPQTTTTQGHQVPESGYGNTYQDYQTPQAPAANTTSYTPQTGTYANTSNATQGNYSQYSNKDGYIQLYQGTNSP